MKNKHMQFKAVLTGLLLSILAFNNRINAQYIPMTFQNGSMKSIALEIPGVMNPNLSPMSTSGVSLKVGQKVYFSPEGKKEKKSCFLLLIQHSKKILSYKLTN